MTQSDDISSWQAWLLASRPKTLAAAMVPVLVGTAIAWRADVFRAMPALAALLGAWLIQIGTNYANDYFDFKKGADGEDRLGPTRVVQSGLLPPGAVVTAMGVTFGMATAIGVYLTWVAGWPIVVIGLASIASGIAYTGGPYPLGYHGLGDVFVFLFFGVVAVVGTFYVQALTVSSEAFVASVPVGCLSVAILVVNNYRDIESDERAGKRTLAVRLGRRGTRMQYAAMLGVAYAVPIWQWATRDFGPWTLLPLVTLPLAIRLFDQLREREGRRLNDTLAGTARLTALFGILYAGGLAFG
jgi:1,4-dihydroxy-2-naphthoate octaprenyltransferase